MARTRGNDRALVWCDELGAEAVFTYADIKRLSDKAANAFRKAGIGKGDPVMLELKRRHEFWPSLLALHKLGAIAIPATHLLTTKDIVYRCKAADVKMIVCVDDPSVMDRVDEAQGSAPTLVLKAFVKSVHAAPDANPAAGRTGWIDMNGAVSAAGESFERPRGAVAAANDDIMLLYFTSGTTGMPKMVRHDFAYPLGHILTAKYWQCVRDGGLHLTVADTGWAKAAWGKIYGQWLCGVRGLRVRLRPLRA